MIDASPPPEARRLEILHASRILDTPPEEAFDRIARAAAQACGVPVGLVSFVAEDRVWFKARVGLDVAEVPRTLAFCAQAIQSDAALVVPDASRDARFMGNSLVAGPDRILAYAGVPLIAGDGSRIGAVCVLDRLPRTPTTDQLELLQVLGRAAAAELELRRTRAHPPTPSNSHAGEADGPSLLQQITGQVFPDDTVRVFQEAVEHRVDLRVGELRRQFALVKSILDGTTDAIFVKDLEGRYLYMNPAGAEMLGRSVAEVLGKVDTELFPPESGRRFMEDDRALISSDRTTTHEDTATIAGVEHHWLTTKGPCRDDAGSVIGVVGIAKEVTETRRAEAAQRESELRFRAVFEQSPLGIAIIESESGRFRVINDTYCRLVGYAREEMLARDLASITHPDDLQEDLDNMKRLLEGEIDVFRMDKRYYHRDGAVVWVRLTCVPLGLDATGPRMHLAFVEDIGERVRAAEAQRAGERRIEAVLEAVTEGVWDWNIATGESKRSRRWYESLGYDPNEIIPHVQFWWRIIHPDDLPVTRKALRDHLDGRTPVYRVENRLRKKSGVYRWNLDQGKVVEWDGEGKPLRMVGADTDISDRKRVEHRERNRTKVLELLTSGAPLPEILDFIARAVESELPGALCSILLLDEDGQRLLHGAAPSLPAFYNEAIHGMKVGDGRGSCGTAAYRGERVVVENVQTHPYWEDFRELARKANVSACWSQPILGRDQEVLGTFAIYYRVPSATTPEDIQVIEAAAGYVQLAIASKRAGEALLASQRFVQAIADASPSTMYVFDRLAGRNVWANRHIAADLGYTPETIQGMGSEMLPTLIHPEDLPHVLDCCGRWETAADGQVLEVEYRMKHADGTWRWLVSYETAFTRLPSGQVQEIVGTAWDVTERRLTAQALRESEERFRILFETTADGVAVFENGRIAFANPAFLRLLGADSLDQVLGKSPFDIVHPDFHAIIRERMRTVIEQREGVPFLEELFLRLDGEAVPVEVASTPIEIRGQRAIQVTARDLTDRKSAETVLRSHSQVLLSMAEGVNFTDDRGIIRFTNPAFDRMFGYESGEIIGRHISMLNDLTGEENTRFVAKVAERLRHAGNWQGEVVNRRKDGTRFYTYGRVTALEDAGERCWVTVQEDITERRRAEGQLRQVQDELAFVSRLSTVGEMAAGLAHEINQPLGAMSNYLAACLIRLRHVPGATDVVELIEAAAKETLRAGGVIRRLRDFILKRAPHYSTVDLGELIREVARLVHGDVVQHDAVLTLELDDTLPPILCDRIQIDQIIVNLVRNALEAMSGAGTRPRVITLRTARGEDDVVVSVLDTGPGLLPGMASRLFEPFATSKPHGMGLGLVICQSLVQAHGGTIRGETLAGGGAAFHFTLPLRPRGDRS